MDRDEHKQLATFYEENEVMELIQQKAKLTRKQEEKRLNIHRLALSVLACYYRPKL